MGEKRSRPSNRSEDAPSSLEQFTQSYAMKTHFTRGTTTYKFTIDCATIKHFLVLGRTLSDRRSRAMSTPGVVKGAPSLPYKTLYKLLPMHKEIILQNYKLALQNGIYEQNIPRGQLEPSGKACPSKEHQWRNPREMANSRGLAFDLLQ